MSAERSFRAMIRNTPSVDFPAGRHLWRSERSYTDVIDFALNDWNKQRQAEKDLVAKKKREAKAAIAELTGEIEPVEDVPKAEKPIVEKKAEEVPAPPAPQVPQPPPQARPPPVVEAPKVERPSVVEKPVERPKAVPPPLPIQQPPRAYQPPPVVNDVDQETCPACGRVVGSKDVRCGHCGKYLTRVCTHCGTAITPKHVFCTKCGFRLQR